MATLLKCVLVNPCRTDTYLCCDIAGLISVRVSGIQKYGISLESLHVSPANSGKPEKMANSVCFTCVFASNCS